MRNNLKFFGRWLRNPARVGSVVPSSRALAAAMAAEIDPLAPGVVVELGGGTGNITAALLNCGIRPTDIVVIEREASLAEMITKRFPEVTVILGDAQHLQSLLQHAGVGKVKAIVSGLPLLSLPRDTERWILNQCFAVLPVDGYLVQFTYGPRAPVERSIAESLKLMSARAAWVLENLPPAAVWVYRRQASLLAGTAGTTGTQGLKRSA